MGGMIAEWSRERFFALRGAAEIRREGEHHPTQSAVVSSVPSIKKADGVVFGCTVPKFT
jgi:hypothetical protein